jgi:hypothetical protein
MDDFVNHSLDDTGTCPCCGTITRMIKSEYHHENLWVCDYLIRWTRGNKNHPWAIFMVTKTEGDGYVGITVEYRIEQNSFMVRDSTYFQWPGVMLEKNPTQLNREDIVGNDFGKWIFSILDYIWLKDPCLPRKSKA